MQRQISERMARLLGNLNYVIVLILVHVIVLILS